MKFRPVRFLSLDLERYGPFTSKTLRFRPDARLHVVYGPNEAGKSSALASLADLLFGFEKSTKFDFIHKTSELRIGAEIVGRNGQRLNFKRRKGNKDTLLSMTGEPLRDDALLPFLGGLTRDVFDKAFGLNSIRLQEGAEELLESDADKGAGLFAAASGLHGLRQLMRQFDQDADAIFAQRYSGQRKFYQALDRHKEARAAIMRTELRAPTWAALNDEIARLEDRIGEHGKRRDELARERARLERLARVNPVLRLLDDDAAKLQSLADLSAYDADASRRIEKAIAELRSVQQTEASETERLQRAEKDLAAITVEELLLAHEVEIDSVRDLSAYRKFAEDLPRIEGEAAALRGDLQALAIRLGIAEGTELETLQPPDAAKASSRKLLETGRDLISALERLDRELASDRQALEQMAGRNRVDDAIIDPTVHRRSFAALRQALTAIAQRGQMATQIAADRQKLVARGKRLAPPVADIAQVATASLPTLEAVTRSRNVIDELEQKAKEAQGTQDRANKELTQADAALTKMTRAGTPPSPDLIAAARQRRGRKWAAIADHLSGARTRTADDISEAQEDFLAAVNEADRLADEALRDAGRVADYANAELRRQAASELVANARQSLTEIGHQRREAAAQWAGQWRAVAIDPLTPAEMQTWLTSVAALLEDADKLSERALAVQHLDEQAGRTLASLQAIAMDLGLKPAPDVTPETLADLLETKLSDLEAGWSAQRDAAARRQALTESIERKTAQRAEISERLDAWQAQWKTAASRIGLSSDATREQVEVALRAWDSLPQVLKERDDRERRVKGMQRDMLAIENKARALILALDPDLNRLAPSDAIAQLSQRLDRARKAATQRESARKRVGEAQAAVAAAAALRQRCTDALASACAGIAVSEVEALVARLKQRDGVLRDWHQHRDELARAGSGLPEESLRRELQDFNADDVEAALNVLKQESVELVEREKDDHALRRAKLAEREALESGTGAELSAINRASAEAELAGFAQEWLVLKFSQRLIEETIRRHRAGREDVLMQRAGHLFSQLTGKAFSGLQQSFDDDDKLRLFARRARGDLVDMSGMSEGTRDQLYLALRLAFLEDYARKAEPAPFVADDIFTTFDDARSGNGLEVLAAAGEILQPILFTHHASVVAEAEKRLGSAVEVIAL